MSPNDVCIIDELEDLIDAGIDSFKIDGILKSVEYMTEVTAMYVHGRYFSHVFDRF